MKKVCLATFSLFFAVFFSSTNASEDDQWQRVYETGPVLVERRDYPGSELHEIKGVTRLKASLGAVMALLKDAEYNRQWVYRSGGATIVREEGYSRAYVHGVVDAPWPMRDRDTVVRFDYQQDPVSKTITITITNFPGFLPVSEQFVRVPDFGGYWRLEPESDGWARVTYRVYGDPGGQIPVWLANYAALISVIRTLQNMPTAVKRYTGAESRYVQELSPVAPGSLK